MHDAVRMQKHHPSGYAYQHMQRVDECQEILIESSSGDILHHRVGGALLVFPPAMKMHNVCVVVLAILLGGGRDWFRSWRE